MPPQPIPTKHRRGDPDKYDFPGSTDNEEAEAPPRKKVALTGPLYAPKFEAALNRVKERLDDEITASKALQQELEDANTRCKEQARQLAATAAAHGKLQGSWDELRSGLDKLNGEYDQWREKCTTRETKDRQGYTHSRYTDNVKDELRRLYGQVQKLTRENEDVRGQLADTVGQLQTARVDAAADAGTNSNYANALTEAKQKEQTARRAEQEARGELEAMIQSNKDISAELQMAQKQAATLQFSHTVLGAALTAAGKDYESFEGALGKAKADLERIKRDNTAYRDGWLATAKCLLSFETEIKSPVKLGTTGTILHQVCRLLGVDLAGIANDDWRLVADALYDGTVAPLPAREAWTLVPRAKSVIHGTVELQCLATLAVMMSGAGPGPRQDAVANLCTCVMRCGVTATANFDLVDLVLQRLLGSSTAGESAFLATVLAHCVGTTKYDERIANIVAGRAEAEQVDHCPFDDLAAHISALGLGIEKMRTYCATAGIVWESMGVGLLPGRDNFVVIEFGPRQIHILDKSSVVPRLPRGSGHADYEFQFLDGRTVRVDTNMAQDKIMLQGRSLAQIEYL